MGRIWRRDFWKKGDEVYIIDSFSTKRLDNIQHLLSESRFHLTVGTILNEKTVRPLVQTWDRVFHLAAAVRVRLIIERPIDTIETNMLGTESVLRLANKYKRKVLIASSLGKTSKRSSSITGNKRPYVPENGQQKPF